MMFWIAALAMDAGAGWPVYEKPAWDHADKVEAKPTCSPLDHLTDFSGTPTCSITEEAVVRYDCDVSGRLTKVYADIDVYFNREDPTTCEPCRHHLWHDGQHIVGNRPYMRDFDRDGWPDPGYEGMIVPACYFDLACSGPAAGSSGNYLDAYIGAQTEVPCDYYGDWDYDPSACGVEASTPGESLDFSDLNGC
jgi:hypothetical protein